MKLPDMHLPEEPDQLSDDARRALAGVLGSHLSRLLELRGASEEDIQRDFDAHRRR